MPRTPKYTPEEIRERRRAYRRRRYREKHPITNPHKPLTAEEKRIRRNKHAMEYYYANRDKILAREKEARKKQSAKEKEWRNAKRRYRYRTDDEYRRKRQEQSKRSREKAKHAKQQLPYQADLPNTAG